MNVRRLQGGVALALACACANAVLGGCARRENAYRFRAPLVSSVAAAPPGSGRAGRGEPAGAGRAPHAPTRAGLDRLRAPDGTALARAAGAPAGEAGAGRRGGAAADASGGLGVADALRALVGTRDDRSSHVAFALAALGAIGADVGTWGGGLDSGPDVLALARERDALTKDAPLPGDLVVFDRVDGATDASLVGVVVGTVPRDHVTVEFVYLSRGVIRRGFVTPAVPGVKRDDHGRALNTFVRALTGKARKTDPFLSGQLFRTYVRLDRLASGAWARDASAGQKSGVMISSSPD